MQHRLGDAALGQLGQIEPGAEVIALAAQHHRSRLVGQAGEDGLQLRDQFVVQRIALGRPIEAHVRDGVAVFDAQQIEHSELADGGDERWSHGPTGLFS